MIDDLIGEWIKGILIDGIKGNLSGLFSTVNTKVGKSHRMWAALRRTGTAAFFHAANPVRNGHCPHCGGDSRPGDAMS